MARKKAGPVVTDDGALLLDADFGVIESDKLEEIDQKNDQGDSDVDPLKTVIF